MTEFFSKLQLTKEDLDSSYKYRLIQELEHSINKMIPNLFFRIEVTDRFERVILYVPKQYVKKVRKVVGNKTMEKYFKYKCIKNKHTSNRRMTRGDKL